MLGFLICCLSAAALAFRIYFLIVGPDAWVWLGIVMIILGYFGQLNYSPLEYFRFSENRFRFLRSFLVSGGAWRVLSA
jgi:hypothetical protein